MPDKWVSFLFLCPKRPNFVFQGKVRSIIEKKELDGILESFLLEGIASTPQLVSFRADMVHRDILLLFLF